MSNQREPRYTREEFLFYGALSLVGFTALFWLFATSAPVSETTDTLPPCESSVTVELSGDCFWDARLHGESVSESFIFIDGEMVLPVTVPAPPVESVPTAPAAKPVPTWEPLATDPWLGLPECEHEDSDNCYWDASVRGNGVGDSFIVVDGVVTYTGKE